MTKQTRHTGGSACATGSADPVLARSLVVRGRVQGVGFRPFVQRLATASRVAGVVKNLSGQVLIHAEGTADALEVFEAAVLQEAPGLSRPQLASARDAVVVGYSGFTIAPSEVSSGAEIHIPPDQSICPDCLAEMHDAADRRFRYPFINCTACGPRYTIIELLPYDRSATSMSAFAMCPSCRAEYENPADRRFHAEPVACAECGPSVVFRRVHDEVGANLDGELALAAAISALRDGGIVAVRGIGGYHLMCAADDDGAVARLRQRKRRPHKPLAVMFPRAGEDGLEVVRRSVVVDEQAARHLCDPASPIVVLPRKSTCPLSHGLAPGLGDLGVFLPYSPLHYLLLDGFGAPLVATSGNVSGEPVITARDDAELRLGMIADAFLHHNREIIRPADDPVLRPIAGRVRPLRLGRGIAPLDVALPVALEQPLLAVGGQDKVTVALGIGDRAIISPHIGDLATPRAFDQMVRLAGELPRLFQAEPAAIACDFHPGFSGTRWARRQGLPVIAVQHHAAHASALAAEHPGIARWLIFAWDGVGFGSDRTLWGGEALIGAPGDWRRIASMRPFCPPGGDLAAHAPWRSAAALMWEAGRDYMPPVDATAGEMVRRAWEMKLNAPQTSAVGRLFDAAAALVCGAAETTFEGQGAMQLEHFAARCSDCDSLDRVALPLVVDESGVLRSDWAALLPMLCDQSASQEARALQFHISMGEALLAQVAAISAFETFDAIGLTGGVFQNRILAEQVIARLQAAAYTVELPRVTPMNDGGLAFGQVVEAAARQKRRAAASGMGREQ